MARQVRSDRHRVTPTIGDWLPEWVRRGGPGSGHFEHAGIPGHRGGSLPGDATAEDDRRRAPGKAVRSERIQSLMQSVSSAGGMVALDMDDWPTVAKAWEINARRGEGHGLGSSVDFPGHKEKMLKGVRETIEMQLRVGGPMPERYAVPYLEAYQQLLDRGEFGDRIPLLILRDVITKDEAQTAKEAHPRLNYWAEPDTGVQARYLLHLDAIEALSFQSLRSGHGEDAVFSDFQNWMSEPATLVGNYGQSAPTLTSDMYDNRLAGILIHEYGHSQAWNASSDLGTMTRANALLAVSDVRVREYISYYAGENPTELLAEAYAVMRHPDYEANAQPTTKAIVEYLWRKGPVPDWMAER